MNPSLEYRAWDKQKKKMFYFPYSQVTVVGEFRQLIFGQYENSYYADRRLDKKEMKSIVLLQYTGHNSIDDQKVFAGDLLRFPETEQVYEVRWDNDEGAWGIFYKDMNCFKIGMARFMVLAGNVFEGEKIIETKEGK